MNTPKHVSAAAAALGAIGGSRRSAKKTAAARRNARKPRPRKPKLEAHGDHARACVRGPGEAHKGA